MVTTKRINVKYDVEAPLSSEVSNEPRNCINCFSFLKNILKSSEVSNEPENYIEYEPLRYEDSPYREEYHPNRRLVLNPYYGLGGNSSDIYRFIISDELELELQSGERNLVSVEAPKQKSISDIVGLALDFKLLVDKKSEGMTYKLKKMYIKSNLDEKFWYQDKIKYESQQLIMDMKKHKLIMRRTEQQGAMELYARYIYNNEEIVLKIQHTLLFIYHVVKDFSITGITVAVVEFISKWTNKSIPELMMSQFMNTIATIIEETSRDMETQSDNISKFRTFVEKYDYLRTTQTFAKVWEVILYCFTYNMLDTVVPPKSEMHYLLRKEAKGLFRNKITFGFAVLDCLSFVAERVNQCLKLGTLAPFVFSGTQVANWHMQAKELIQVFEYYKAIEVKNMNADNFLRDLQKCITEGKHIVKFFDKCSASERAYAQTLLLNLEKIETDIKVMAMTSSYRIKPYVTILVGGTSLGKSTLQSCLQHYFCNHQNLPDESQFIFVRDPKDEFYEGITTSHHTIIMNDLAMVKPRPGVEDTSVTEFMSLADNAPKVYNMAFGDKGKVSCRIRHLIGSTNVPNLHTDVYMSMPEATLRRINAYIVVKVKKEFADENGRLKVSDEDMRLAENGGLYPNWWEMTTRYVTSDKCGKLIFHDIAEYTDINEFLRSYGKDITEHFIRQDKVIKSLTTFSKITVCNRCNNLGTLCRCPPLPKVEVVEDNSINKYALYTSTPASTISQDTCVRNPFSTRYVESDFEDKEASEDEEYRPTDKRIFSNNMHHPIRDCRGGYYLEEKGERVPCDKDGCPLYVLKFFGDEIGDTRKKDTQAAEVGYVVNNVAAFTIQSMFTFYSLCLIMYFYKQYTSWISIITPEWFDAQVNRGMNYIMSKCSLRIQEAYYSRVVHYINIYRNPKVKIVLQALAFGAISVATLSMVSRLTRWLMGDTGVEHYDVYVDGYNTKWPESEPASKTNVVDGKKPERMPMDKDKNVWVKDQFDLDTFVKPMASSYSAMTLHECENIIARNCVSLEIPGKINYHVNKAFALYGNMIVTNKHYIDLCPNDEIEVEMVWGENVSGICRKAKRIFEREDFKCVPGTDLVIFEFLGCPPFKDLRGLIATEAAQTRKFKGTYIQRDHQGNVGKNPMGIVSHHEFVPSSLGNIKGGFYHSQPSIPTKKGDCGSLAVIYAPDSIQILGLHTLGDGISSYACPLYPIEFSSELVPQASEPNLTDCVTPLGPLHHKSPLRYVEEGRANVYGTFQGNSFPMKSRVKNSILSKPLEISDPGYTRPVMSGWKPKRTALLPMLNICSIPRRYIKRATKDYLSKLTENLTPEHYAMLHTYDLYTAINGADVTYVESINKQSSTGFPFRKQKKNFCLPDPTVERPHGVKLNPTMYGRVEAVMDKYLKGERYMPIFNACFKDEPVTLEKAKIEKTRVFICAPMEWSIVVRQYLLGFVRLMQTESELFECAVGVNCESKEWEALYDFVTYFGKHRINAGDYKNFDKNMMSDLVLAAFEIIEHLFGLAGATKMTRLIIKLIGLDTAFPLVDFFGDLIEILGSNPSGHPLTVIINCIVNALYGRIVFYVKLDERAGLEEKLRAIVTDFIEGLFLIKELPPDFIQHYSRSESNTKALFHHFVAYLTYGDDIVSSCAECIDFFNHTTMSEVLARYNMVYTMPDKCSASVAYSHIDDTNFLKRKWRYDDELESYAAPLEIESIEKSLSVWVYSKTILPEEQAVAVIQSACRSMFGHGRELHTAFRSRMLALMETPFEFQGTYYDLRMIPNYHKVPTYDELLDSFRATKKPCRGSYH